MATTFTWTDDPEDPCALCVQWETERDDDYKADMIPYMPSGPVDRVYNRWHPECEQSVTDMQAEHSKEKNP